MSKPLSTGKFIVISRTKAFPYKLSNSDDPHQHDTLNEAKREAERLALQVPEKEFIVLEVKGTVNVVPVPKPVTWK